MSNITPLNLIRQKWQTVVSVALLITALVFALSAVQPAKYRSSTRLLIVQNYSLDVDPYAASRSTDHLSNILSEVIYSTNFFDQVMHAGFDIKDTFSQRAEKRQKQWQKTIRAKVINDTGIIAVDVYHRDRYQAGQLAYAIAYILKTKNSDYHGGGEGVMVKTLDEPITTMRPAEPQTLLNTLVALFLGLIFGLALAYLAPQYDLKPYDAAKRRLASWRAKRSVKTNLADAYHAQTTVNQAPNNIIDNRPMSNDNVPNNNPSNHHPTF